jgi:hypothetical protein
MYEEKLGTLCVCVIMVEVANSVQLSIPICLYISLSPVSMFAGKICVTATVSIFVSVRSFLYLQVTKAELLSAFSWHLIRGSSENYTYTNFI